MMYNPRVQRYTHKSACEQETLRAEAVQVVSIMAGGGAFAAVLFLNKYHSCQSWHDAHVGRRSNSDKTDYF